MNIDRIKETVQSAKPAPLHQKLREAIQEQIMDGTLKSGETLPSERAMKDFFSVSRATVRQAVNALINEGFLQSIAGTGTFVLEKATKPSMTGLIGLVTSSPNFNFFYPQLTAAFNQRIRESGYGLVMSLHSEHAETLDQMVDELLAQNVVAMAITPPRYGDITPTLERLRKHKIPAVFIGRNFDQRNLDIVATDNETIGYEATRHLINKGHRHIVFLGLLDYSTGNERASGYQQAMNEAGIPPYIVQINEEELNATNNTISTPREHLASPAKDAVQQIWGGNDKFDQPTAVFCFNDIMAMGVYKGLRELGRTVPDDVSIISVDNLITIRHFEVPLTTFALPGEQIGIHSADILLRRLSGNVTSAETILLPAEFIERASVIQR